MTVNWKIESFSGQRLESEIANAYYLASRENPGVTPPEVGLLGALWVEFDLRVANGTMTDDEEGLLNDTRKY